MDYTDLKTDVQNEDPNYEDPNEDPIEDTEGKESKQFRFLGSQHGKWWIYFLLLLLCVFLCIAFLDKFPSNVTIICIASLFNILIFISFFTSGLKLGSLEALKKEINDANLNMKNNTNFGNQPPPQIPEQNQLPLSLEQRLEKLKNSE
jgi:glucan phosphoethanolaminetransferase (alkaline phosphatase superfamily)